jgi:hypothetical protein
VRGNKFAFGNNFEMFTNCIYGDVLGQYLPGNLNGSRELRVDHEGGGFSHGRNHPLPGSAAGSPVGRAAPSGVSDRSQTHDGPCRADPQPPTRVVLR